jgi:RNA polymerase sigma factor (sigma-70 family)
MDDAAPGMRSTDAARARRQEARAPVPRRFDTDERLIAAVRAGSDEAFRTLYDRHHAVARGVCRRLLGSAEEADDAIQHTFTAAYVDIMRTSRSIAFRPWLLTIARHRCLTVIASRRQSRAYALHDPSSATVSLDTDVREELRALMEDIALLPDDQRVALVMRELGGASYAEIAEILEAPAARGRALVFQARSWLRSSRHAREIPCAEIREQLSSSSGAALRRVDLRHHLRQCEGCRAFAGGGARGRVKLLLPLGPFAALRQTVLGALSTASGGGGVALLDGIAVKVLVTITIAGGGVAGMATSGGSGKQAPPRATLAAATTSAGIDRHPAHASGGARAGTAKPARETHAKVRRAADRSAPGARHGTPPVRTAVPDPASPAHAPARQAEPAKTGRDHGGGNSDARPTGNGKAAEHGKPAAPPPGRGVAAAPGGGTANAPGQSGANAHGNGPPSAPVPPGVPSDGAGQPPKPPKPPGPLAGQSPNGAPGP